MLKASEKYFATCDESLSAIFRLGSTGYLSHTRYSIVSAPICSTVHGFLKKIRFYLRPNILPTCWARSTTGRVAYELIFTSDHGYHLTHHGIWHKVNSHWLLLNNRGIQPNRWDYSLHVPARVRWPFVIPPHTTVDQTVSHLDWFFTINPPTDVELPADLVICGRNILSWTTASQPSGTICPR